VDEAVVLMGKWAVRADVARFEDEEAWDFGSELPVTEGPSGFGREGKNLLASQILDVTWRYLQFQKFVQLII